MYKLKHMKDKLVTAIGEQIDGNLEAVNSGELGDAIDMVKDLSEAIYYCTVTEAMEGNDYSKGSHRPAAHYYGEGMTMYHTRPEDYYYPPYRDERYPIMYNSGNGGANYSSNGGNGTRYYDGTSTRMYYDHSYPMLSYESGDRSSVSRRRYMDGKSRNDKSAQMKELDMYTQELASDLTEMIRDASPEEKQLLQQKISMLASKIK